MKSPPSIAVIMLLPGCNMTCNFCITEDRFGSFTFAEAVGLLDQIKSCGIQNIVMGGGEPTLWPHDPFRLAEEAKAMGFFVQLGTNGIKLPENFAKHPAIDRYVLPLESTEAHVHNEMRIYKKGHHPLILERLHRLRENKKSVTVSTVVTQKNRTHLEKLACFLRDYQKGGGLLHAWHLYKFIPEGRGGRPNEKELLLQDNEFDEDCKKIKGSDWGFPVFRRENMLHSKSVAFYWMEGGTLHSILPP